MAQPYWVEEVDDDYPQQEDVGGHGLEVGGPSLDNAWFPPLNPVNPNGPTRICCMGSGLLAGLSMSVMALMCPNVVITVCDIDGENINTWAHGIPPFEETNLQRILNLPHVLNNRLHFDFNVDNSMHQADVIIVAVDLVTERVNRRDPHELAKWTRTWKAIAQPMNADKLVVEKSAIPLNGRKKIEDLLRSYNMLNNLHIVFNPDFYTEGRGIQQMMNPGIVIFGGRAINTPVFQDFLALYPPQWINPNLFICTPNAETVLLSHMGTNLMLAAKDNVMTTVARLCQKSHADMNNVTTIMCIKERRMDTPGIGFGGPGLVRDLNHAADFANSHGMKKDLTFFNAMKLANREAQENFVELVLNTLNSVQGVTLAIFGFAFRQGTSEHENSPAIRVCKNLLNYGAILQIHDPLVPADNIHSVLRRHGQVTVVATPLLAVTNAVAILVLTDWSVYQPPDPVAFYNQLYHMMEHPSHIFDARYMPINWQQIANLGYCVHAVGKEMLVP